MFFHEHAQLSGGRGTPHQSAIKARECLFRELGPPKKGECERTQTVRVEHRRVAGCFDFAADYSIAAAAKALVHGEWRL